MPRLDLQLYAWETWPTAILQIMNDPGLNHPGDLAESMNKGAAQRRAKGLGASHPIVKERFSSILIGAYDTPKPKEIFADTLYEHRSGEVWRGSMSGTILLHVLSRAALGDQRVSIRSTNTKIAEACQNRVSGAQVRELIKSWDQFSPVSHLWATMRLSENGWLETGRWGTVVHSHEQLLIWLSCAQTLYHSGVACRLWKSKKGPTLLDPERAWCLLPGEPLPVVSVTIPHPDLLIRSLAQIGQSK